MHVAHRLGKTVGELLRGIDSPSEIGEWLSFFGNPHLVKEPPKPPVKSNADIRAWVDRHNNQVKG
jgi:hypothetical protein